MTMSQIHARTLLVLGLVALAFALPLPPRALAAEGDGEAAALSAKGRALIHAGKLKEAEDALRKAAKLRAGSIDALYDLARVEFATGDLKRAKNACKALVTQDAAHVLTQVCQARAFLLWRRASRAEEFLDKARTIDASHPEALLAFADAKRISGELVTSKDAYQQVLGLDPSNAEAHFGLGELLVVEGDREGAKRAFREALSRDPEWVDAQYQLGRLSQGAEAVALLEKVSAARPELLEAKLALASAKADSGDSAGAEALLRGLLGKQPKSAAIHARLGIVLLAKQDYAAAEPELTQGLAGLPNDPETVLAMARLYAATDRAEDAFTQYQNASSLDRQNPTPLIEAGVVALKLSRNALAVAFLEKAVERAPKHAPALARYADALLARGDKALAKQYYARALVGEGAIDRADVEQRLRALK